MLMMNKPVRDVCNKKDVSLYRTVPLALINRHETAFTVPYFARCEDIGQIKTKGDIHNDFKSKVYSIKWSRDS